MTTITKPFTFEYAWDDNAGISHYTIKKVQLTYDEKILDDMNNSEPGQGELSFGRKFHEFIEIIESDYGVHDVGYCPDEEFYGFNSYEIEENKIDEHWQKILDFFKTVGSDYFVIGPDTTVDEIEED
jgi:hypothetical protein